MMMSKVIGKTLPPLLILLAASGAARAHIVLDQQEAEAGTAYKAVFKVGHGCAGSAVRQITVTLPPGLRGAKPMPKPGWTLALRSANGAVAEISWTANSEADQLQDAWYDEFVLRATLPEQPGELWFKIKQSCVVGAIDWAELPGDGVAVEALKTPAARLMVKSKAPASAAAHAHH
jgi:uncharacterized protein YcnI